MGLGFTMLNELLWDAMECIRIYVKEEGKKIEFKWPIVLGKGRGSTVDALLGIGGKKLKDEFSHAFVWGRSVKGAPVIVEEEHVLMDEDVIMLVKRVKKKK